MYIQSGLFPIWLILLVMCSSGCHRPLHFNNTFPAPGRHPNPPSEDAARILEQYPSLFLPEPILQKFDSPAEAKARKFISASAVRSLALDHNPDVVSAEEEVHKAKALLGEASAWPNPELDARVVMSESKTIQSEAAFRFSIPLGGRIGASQRLAAARYDRARLDLEAARRKALLEVDRTIIRIAYVNARIQLLGALSDRSAQTINIVRTGIEATIGDPIDAALVSAGIVSDRFALQREQIELYDLENRLRLLAGLAPHEGLAPIAGPAGLPIQPDPQKLIQTALTTSPEVLRQKLNVMIADNLAAKQAAERIPDLHIGPALVAEEGREAWGISLGMSIPLFQSGGGQYQAALAQRNLALRELEQTSRGLAAEIISRCKELHSVRTQLDQVIVEPSTELERALDMAEARYRAGKLDVLRLLAVHRAFSELKLMHLDLVYRQHALMIDLENLTGRSLRNQKDLP